MKCHYEVLGLSSNASDDDLKKAYRKLALKWHPDKNIDNAEEAKKEFQLIQAAYDVLSDPQERAWYDRHRDAILLGAKGSDYQENTVNIYEYFTSACYSGYNDEEQGFYAVYRELFNKIGAEDMEFADEQDSDFEIPEFGNSTSNYEEVVRPFYAYWQSYCTMRPYSWLDKYDFNTLKEVPRRIQRLMERENKKLREVGRKQRNEEVRHLVSFVRKRDPRVKEYIKVLEEKAAQNVLKTKQQQDRHREKRRQLLEQSQEKRFAQFSELEAQLKEIEAHYTSSEKSSDSEMENADEVNGSGNEVADGEEENNEDYESELLELYCAACNKLFKTPKAKESHIRSKKHKDKVKLLRESLLEDGIDESLDEELEEEEEVEIIKTKKKKKKKKNKVQLVVESDDEEIEADEYDVKQSKQEESLQAKNVIQPDVEYESNDEAKLENNQKKSSKKEDKKMKKKNKNAKSDGKSKNIDIQIDGNEQHVRSHSEKKKSDLQCAVCSDVFPSKNKLFEHLKASNHAVFVQKNRTGSDEISGKRKGKQK